MPRGMTFVWGLVAGILATAGLMVALHHAVPPAQAQTADSGGGWVAASASISNTTQVVFLFDTADKHLLVYDATLGKLRLIASRKCEYDLKMIDFVNPATSGSGPKVSEIKAAAKKAENDDK